MVEKEKVGDEVLGKAQIYRLKAPSWRPRLHPGSKAIGIPGIHYHDAAQPEDTTSEASVTHGFSVPQVVGNETFSAHDMIYDCLKAKSLLFNLSTLFHEVSLRRNDLTNLKAAAGPLQSRPPQRVTLNEIKLAAYVKELADPEVPLKKLARSVPHGYRGERMLDMLWNGGSMTPALAAIKAQSVPGNPTNTSPRSVSLERATWFVRVVGYSELTSSRARQGNVSGYTGEWTTIFMGWLRKQIVELNVIQSAVGTPTTPSSPSAARSGLLTSAKGNLPMHVEGHYSLLLDDDFRQRWVSRWRYSIMLFRSLCQEHLIDLQVAAKIALDMMRTANIAQISFVLALLEDVLPTVFSSASLLHHALDTLCGKAVDLTASLRGSRFGSDIVKELQVIIVHIATRCRDSLVAPTRWSKYRDFLTELLTADFPKGSVELIRIRNENLLRALLGEQGASKRDSEVGSVQADIATLDSIAVEQNIEQAFLQLFRPDRRNSSDRLRTVLIWSTTCWRSGRYRAFAGAKILHHFSQSRLTVRGKVIPSIPKVDLGTLLLKWISEVDIAKQPGLGVEKSTSLDTAALRSVEVSSLIVLVGELIRLGVFSYPKYLQRLTARGLTATQGREENGESGAYLHAKILRSVSLSSTSASLEHQRKVAIYGNRSKESWEEAMQRRASRELASAFPWRQFLQSTEEQVVQQTMRLKWDAGASFRHFWSSSRFVQSRVIHECIVAYFHQQSMPMSLSESCFAHLSHFLVKAEDFISLAEIIILLYEKREVISVSLQAVYQDVALEHRLVWTAMGIPLLEQLGLHSSAPLVAEERSVSLHPQSNDLVRDHLAESAVAHLCEDFERSTQMMRQAAEGFPYTESLPYTLLAAVLTAVQASTSTSDKLSPAVEWMKLVLTEAGRSWDINWQQDLVDVVPWLGRACDSASAASIAALLLHLMHSALILPAKILRSLIVTQLDRCAERKAEKTNPRLQIALLLVRGLLPSKEDGEYHTVDVRKATIWSTLIRPGSIENIISAIGSLAVLEQDGNADAASLRNALCCDTLVQVHTRPKLFECLNRIRRVVHGHGLDSIVSDLDPSHSTLLTQKGALEVDYPSLIDGIDVWHIQQRLFELCVLIHRLEAVEVSQQNRSQSKIQSVARSLAKRWFTRSHLYSRGLPLLLESRSSTFTTTITEELLNTVQELLSDASSGETKAIIDVLWCLAHLTQSQARLTLSSSSPAGPIVHSITEWLGAKVASMERDPSKDVSTEQAQLGYRLSLICLLLRLENLWTAQMRNLAPSLAQALLILCIHLSAQNLVQGAVAGQLLDVAAYCLQEMPAEVHQTFLSNADTISDSMLREVPESSVGSRILLLINRTPASMANRMILANSCTSAFSPTGHLTVVVEKPWELHNNVEALDLYSRLIKDASSATTEDNTAAKDDEIGSSALPNNGPISLELFGARRLKDRLSDDTLPVDAESSYGLGWGGEPMYRRDTRRGLLSLQSDRDSKMQTSARRRDERKVEHASSTDTAVSTVNSSSTTASKKRREPTSTAPTSSEIVPMHNPKKIKKR